jgi:V/A-type H+-transporting ATPase subunit D
MVKVKLTKGELKKQRDCLKQYQRYLPTLQLKKQQIQIEITRLINAAEEKKKAILHKKNQAKVWSGLLHEAPQDFPKWLIARNIMAQSKNIAGVDIPVLEKCEFTAAEYDLFLTPLWVDAGLEFLRGIVSLEEELKFIEEGSVILRQELRITTQRLNLFEKVKIPQAQEAIRVIKIYIGDQLANAVGRSKIAKMKIEKSLLEEVYA